jgi:hypothetical protein
MPFPIEFGHRVLVIQDGGGFIVHAEVMGIEWDCGTSIIK